MVTLPAPLSIEPPVQLKVPSTVRLDAPVIFPPDCVIDAPVSTVDAPETVVVPLAIVNPVPLMIVPALNVIVAALSEPLMTSMRPALENGTPLPIAVMPAPPDL